MTDADAPSDPSGSDLPRDVRLPAEWEPHRATWLSWPHNRDTWPGCFEPIPEVWAELVRVIAAHEPVHVLAGGEAVMADAASRVGLVASVTLHDVATNDAWIRDHGPMFLSGDAEAAVVLDCPRLLDWEYDAWGGKYPPFDLDNGVPRAVAELIGARRTVPQLAGQPVVLEGGAIESNGAGTVLACASCLVGPRRNDSLTRSDFERLLRDYAGVRHVIWLEGVGDVVGIAGDDTDGHIDQLARFVSPTRVVLASERDASDANFSLLASLREQLLAATTADGESLELVELPMPRPVLTDAIPAGAKSAERLPASYANFYVANGVVVVPQFGGGVDDGIVDEADALAREILAGCFPQREIVGFPSRALVHGLGGVHCVTLSQPLR